MIIIISLLIAGFRTQIASDGSLIHTIVPLLSNKQDSIQLQAMRAIGNLCHDEGRAGELLQIFLKIILSCHGMLRC